VPMWSVMKKGDTSLEKNTPKWGSIQSIFVWLSTPIGYCFKSWGFS
jgi:hypothetical protein